MILVDGRGLSCSFFKSISISAHIDEHDPEQGKCIELQTIISYIHETCVEFLKTYNDDADNSIKA